MKNFIYISGTNSSGKSEVSRYLAEKYGFEPLNARTYLEKRAATEEEHLGNRPEFRNYADRLRDRYGSEVVVRELTNQAEQYDNAVVESIRCMGEVAYKNYYADKHQGNVNVIFVGVDAMQELRYKRASKRKGKTDFVSYQQFLEQEEAESVSLEQDRMNIRHCLQEADVMLFNNGSVDEFHEQIEEKVVPLLKLQIPT